MPLLTLQFLAGFPGAPCLGPMLSPILLEWYVVPLHKKCQN